mmetsp:Transcript_12492/g.14396  ORF Transcript_12492/g.14396 Transcript_12492/m.14396 type:complete len:170 (+) Transcript_12492:58-567(+)
MSASRSRGRSVSTASSHHHTEAASPPRSTSVASNATADESLQNGSEVPRRDFICGIPIDHSKTFTSVSRVFPPRKSTLRRYWEIFGAETCVGSFEPWERVITMILYAGVLTPVVWKLTSFVWFLLHDVMLEALVESLWYQTKVAPIVEALAVMLPSAAATASETISAAL